MEFMRGRYGMDSLNKFLLGFSLFIWLVNVFVFHLIATLVLYGVQLLVLGLMFFRMFSHNVVMRSKENRVFLKFWGPVKNWVTLQVKKIRERKDFKYLKCPYCKAQLRVKNQKGKHGVRCPKCGDKFEVTI